MLHQDGSPHRWIPALDRSFDLIVTMDDATSEIYSAFLVEEEGTMSSFVGLRDVVAKHGLFCSLYSDRGSHYFNTPAAGGKVDEDNLTQVGRALAQLGIEHIPAYSPAARGRSERMFGTLQDRPAQGAAAGRHRHARSRQPLPRRGLSTAAQRPLRGRGQRTRQRLRARSRRPLARHPVRAGRAHRRQ
jgi:hypothetical protein